MAGHKYFPAEELPCPCCDSAATLKREGIYGGRAKYGDPMRFYIECSNNRCGLRTKYFANPIKALRAWNSRSAEQAQHGKKAIPAKEFDDDA